MIETKEILDDHIITLKGFAFKSAWYTESGVPIVKISDFTQDSVSLDKICYIPIENTYDLEKYRLQKGDVLIQTVGSWEHNPNSVVGKVTRIPELLNDSLLNQNIVKIIPKETLDNTFLYYLLKNEAFKGYIINTAQGAATQASITLDSIKAFKFIYKKLPTQRKIASILSAYDDLIENNLKRIKLLEEKAQMHYKELMLEMSFAKVKNEVYIKDCFEFYIGGGWGEEDYKEGFTEPAFVIRGTDIPDAKKGEVKGVPFRYHKESNLASRSMKAGDIVFEVSGGSKGQPVGRSILVNEKMLQQFGKSVMCASFCKMLRPNEKVTPEFFYLYLLASHENGVIAQYEKHSASNIVNYGFEEFIGEQKITIPKETELKAFTEKVKPIFTLISTLGEQNSKLREARDILLPKLMSGQIEV
jgi:type I restriction enzyme S subunit